MREKLFLILLISCSAAFSQVPYNETPDWESTPADRISTGLALADINGDGYKDMIIADGNDISIQHLTVHYNDGYGSFSSTPDWQSEDVDYHGHLVAADFNQDGWYDVAVSVYIGKAGFSQPGKLKVYYNQHGELEPEPSFESMPFYSFSCAAGDANADGWVDIAVACGEPYNEISDNGRIFYNINGYFSNDSIWESDIQMSSIDVEFGDVIQNGFLDVIFAGAGEPNYVYAADTWGVIQTNPAWQSTDAENYVNSIDVVYNQKVIPESHFVIMTGNDQLGGDGKVKLYVFNYDPLPNTPEWSSEPFGYGSGVLFSDVNNNDTVDLIYGGWWLPVNVAMNAGFGFEQPPSYTSSTSSVVEAIAVADLSKNTLYDKVYHYTLNQHTNIFYIKDKDVESIDSVQHENVVLPDTAWTYIPGKNWILLKDRYSPGQHLFAYYKASEHRDMVVSNWDPGKGNYIFYNKHNYTGVNRTFAEGGFHMYPNPANKMVYFQLKEDVHQISIYDPGGRRIIHITAKAQNSIKLPVDFLDNGVYIVKVYTENGILTRKLLIFQ